MIKAIIVEFIMENLPLTMRTGLSPMTKTITVVFIIAKITFCSLSFCINSRFSSRTVSNAAFLARSWIKENQV